MLHSQQKLVEPVAVVVVTIRNGTQCQYLQQKNGGIKVNKVRSGGLGPAEKNGLVCPKLIYVCP